jgi:hypothetical protein
VASYRYRCARRYHTCYTRLEDLARQSLLPQVLFFDERPSFHFDGHAVVTGTNLVIHRHHGDFQVVQTLFHRIALNHFCPGALHILRHFRSLGVGIEFVTFNEIVQANTFKSEWPCCVVDAQGSGWTGRTCMHHFVPTTASCSSSVTRCTCAYNERFSILWERINVYSCRMYWTTIGAPILISFGGTFYY